MGSYITFALGGFIASAIFIDNIPSSWTSGDIKGDLTVKLMQSLRSKFAQLKHTDQLFLIPFSIYVGFQNTFYFQETNKVHLLA